MQNRRDWLKSALAISAGWPLGAALSQKLMAAPVGPTEQRFWMEHYAAPIKIRLNSNENPYGPSERARQAIADATPSSNRYAFDTQVTLKELIAQHEGVSADHVALGAGSGELLCQAGAAFGVEGGRILSAYPTFPLLMNYAEVFNAKWEKVNVNDKLEHDYETLATHATKETSMVFICNPNNPTGTLVDPGLVKQFCEDVSKRTVVYADEAYLEFLEPAQQQSMIELVKTGHNVVVSRTFSKIYGLAGLRMGYVIGKPEIVARISRYNMAIANNQPAVAAAKASLGDRDFMERSRTMNAEARKHLTDYLDKRGISYGKSYTNFVFFPAESNARDVLANLAAKGIGIRVWDYNSRPWYRVSIGTLDEMKTFTKTFDELA